MLTYPSLREHILGPYHPDVFIHTYDKMGNGDDDDVFVSESWIDGLLRPKALRMRSLAEMAPQFAKERDRLFAIPGPIWPLGAIPNVAWRFQNVLSQLWHVYECDLLRREHEERQGFHYDLVIRARMDSLFQEAPDPLWQLGRKNFSPNAVFLPHHSGYGGYCDQFAMGSSDAITVYSDFYLHVEDVWRSRILLPCYWGPPENFLRRYIEKFSGLEPVLFNFPFELQRAKEVEHQSYRDHHWWETTYLKQRSYAGSSR